MEISRKTFLDILRLVDGDYDKADQICKLVEESTPMVPAWSAPINNSQYIWGGYMAPSTWTLNNAMNVATADAIGIQHDPNMPPPTRKKITLNGLGQDPSKIWGITE